MPVSAVFSQDPGLAEIRDKDPEAAKAAYVLGLMAKYGAFMSNMINTKSSDEVAQAIEAAADRIDLAMVARKIKQSGRVAPC